MASADHAVETGVLDDILVTNASFRHEFLSHIRQQFGPEVLLPSIEMDVTNGGGMMYFCQATRL